MINDPLHYLQYIAALITPERFAKMQDVVDKRTRHLSVVIEDIYQSHNASAVLRSCECFGLCDVHIIENRNTYEVNPDIALGASKWLNLHRYNQSTDNTTDCIQKLKKDGFRVVATGPHKNDCYLHELDITQKTALLFGNELDGLSQQALQLADAYVKIPMVGFTESLNISVSVAVSISQLSERLRNSNTHWQLSENERTEMLIQWVKNTIRFPEKVEKEYIQRFQS
jgi:tRNA (guanosine-2'-O-)-methyltransferase